MCVNKYPTRKYINFELDMHLFNIIFQDLTEVTPKTGTQEAKKRLRESNFKSIYL